MYKKYIKRVVDILGSFIALLLLSPIFIVITLILFIVNNGRPFFLQKRPGKFGQLFYVIKFKTMNDKKDKFGVLLSDEKRLTALGAFIRKTSLDEIPQLINVFIGDMSLIGPRPLLIQYLELYNSFQNRRHELKPGITGWAQVNGRNAISWNKKFELDVWYVDNCSIWIDFKIFLLTIKKVFLREGINSKGHATMSPFRGNKIIHDEK